MQHVWGMAQEFLFLEDNPRWLLMDSQIWDLVWFSHFADKKTKTLFLKVTGQVSGRTWSGMQLLFAQCLFIFVGNII